MQNFPYHNRYLLYAIGILCGSILAAYIGMLPPKQAQAQSPRAGAFVLYMPIMHTMTKPPTTPTPSGPFFNRAVVVSCDSNEASTYVRGTVRQNGQPVNGHRVVFSWHPDGEVVAGITSGHYSDWAQGYYSHILQAGGPREGNWWFWIQDEAGKRISSPRGIAYVREVADTLLLSESSARQLRDVLDNLFAEPAPQRMN